MYKSKHIYYNNPKSRNIIGSINQHIRGNQQNTSYQTLSATYNMFHDPITISENTSINFDYNYNNQRSRVTYANSAKTKYYSVVVIHMNARIYDPFTKMFLQPDNIIQDNTKPDNYNRYGYCLNNPLKYTDPSGNVPIAPVFLAIIIGASVSSTVYLIKAAFNISFSCQGLGIAALQVAISGAASYGIGGVFSSISSLPNIGFIGGFVNGGLGGFGTGFVLGTVNSLINGGELGESLFAGIYSGLVGGLIGGISGGLNAGAYAQKHHGNYWTGEGTISDLVLDGNVVAGQDNVDKNHPGNVEVKFNQVNADKFRLENFPTEKDKLIAASKLDPRLQANKYTQKGDRFYNSKGEEIGGATIYNGVKENTSDVFLFKNAFYNKATLYLAMGHEFIHARFNKNGFYGLSIEYQHAIINDWQYDQWEQFAWPTLYPGYPITRYTKNYNYKYEKFKFPLIDWPFKK